MVGVGAIHKFHPKKCEKQKLNPYSHLSGQCIITSVRNVMAAAVAPTVVPRFLFHTHMCNY